MRPHPDVDDLALLALGESVLDAAERAHVAGCVRCGRTVAELSDTVAVVRGPRPDDVAPVPVPAHVWRGIAEELDLDPAVRPASVGPSAVLPGTTAPGVDAVGTDPAGTDPAGSTSADVSTGTHADRPDGTPLDELGARRSGRGAPLRLLAVAAAGLVVGAAGTAAVASWRSDAAGAPPVAAPASGDVVAAADLQAFGAGEGTGVSGAARLAVLDGPDEGSEDRVLEVRLDSLPDTGDDFLEAWLIDADTGAMVSLGAVPAPAAGEATAALTVPRGLDVGTFDLVDVSAEPLDGDPTHSGVSLVRGTLST